jgi:hypothetical protein
VRGRHLGGPIADGEPAASSLAAEGIGDWLTDRFPSAGYTTLSNKEITDDKESHHG